MARIKADALVQYAVNAVGGGGGGYNSGRRGNGYQGWLLIRVPINSVIV